MSGPRKHRTYGAVLYSAFILTAGTYFTFASVQGDFGLFQRVQINAEGDQLIRERDALLQEVVLMRNKTLRLSDDFLDLDLLDEQARDVLGLLRSDEVVIR